MEPVDQKRRVKASFLVYFLIIRVYNERVNKGRAMNVQVEYQPTIIMLTKGYDDILHLAYHSRFDYKHILVCDDCRRDYEDFLLDDSHEECYE